MIFVSDTRLAARWFLPARGDTLIDALELLGRYAKGKFKSVNREITVKCVQ